LDYVIYARLRHCRKPAACRALPSAYTSPSLRCPSDHGAAKPLWPADNTTPGAIHRTHRACNHLVALAKKVLGEIQAAERDIARISQQASGSLRIVLECHTCFDWLMPLMDEFRQHWPDVELDLVSGFHSDPVKLLEEGGADMIIRTYTAARHCPPSVISFRYLRGAGT